MSVLTVCVVLLHNYTTDCMLDDNATNYVGIYVVVVRIVLCAWENSRRIIPAVKKPIENI